MRQTLLIRILCTLAMGILYACSGSPTQESNLLSSSGASHSSLTLSSLTASSSSAVAISSGVALSFATLSSGQMSSTQVSSSISKTSSANILSSSEGNSSSIKSSSSNVAVSSSSLASSSTGTSACTASATVGWFTCAANNPKIRILGRADMTDPLRPVLAWSGASFSIAFTGTAAQIHLQGMGSMYDVFVDTATSPTSVLDLSTDNTELHSVASNLSNGPHTLKVFKRTEAQYGKAVFGGFDIHGSIADLPTAATHKIEYIGNSITCGYGDLANANSDPFLLSTEDHYFSYTATSARSLGAEHHTVCFSGRGMVRNNDNSTTGTLPQLYNLIDPNSSATWSFSQWTPEVISINLGTNDFYLGPPDSASYVNATIAFVKQLTTYYPNVTIFIVDGPMLSDYYPSNANPYNANIKNTTDYVLNGSTIKTQTINQRYLDAAKSTLNAQGYAKVFRVKFPAQDGTLGYGADWHPNKAEHTYLAGLLTIAIKNQLGW